MLPSSDLDRPSVSRYFHLGISMSARRYSAFKNCESNRRPLCATITTSGDPSSAARRLSTNASICLAASGKLGTSSPASMPLVIPVTLVDCKHHRWSYLMVLHPARLYPLLALGELLVVYDGYTLGVLIASYAGGTIVVKRSLFADACTASARFAPPFG